MISKVSSTSSLPSVKEEGVQEKAQGTFSSHTVEQKNTSSVQVPTQATLSINPTGKQEKETASLSIQQRKVDEEKAVDIKSILEQQISGILQETKIKGFTLSLEHLSFPKQGENPITIEADIQCSTSYDNRKNVAKVLERVHAVVLPILQQFATTYNDSYKSSRGLSPEEKEKFQKEVQQILAQYMPRDTPSLGSLLKFAGNKPTFSLSPEYMNKEGANKVLEGVQQVMKNYRIGGLVVAMKGTIKVDELITKESEKLEAKRKQQEYYNRLKKT